MMLHASVSRMSRGRNSGSGIDSAASASAAAASSAADGDDVVVDDDENDDDGGEERFCTKASKGVSDNDDTNVHICVHAMAVNDINDSAPNKSRCRHIANTPMACITRSSMYGVALTTLVALSLKRRFQYTTRKTRASVSCCFCCCRC